MRIEKLLLQKKVFFYVSQVSLLEHVEREDNDGAEDD